MNFRLLVRATLLATGIAAAPSPSSAEGLPDLGEAAQADFSPAMERRAGEQVMQEIRRDPAWLDDAEVNAYLNRLGNRLAAQSTESRQEFEFFTLRDASLNAFAMPGGYIGVHSGLILAAASESELASVLAHEISHVTQRHLARLLTKQGQGQMGGLLALAVAVLAARGNPDLAMGAMMAGQGAAIQHQLNYSRDFEREADRIGLGLLERSGYDIRGMGSFFERLQKYGRLYENNAPGYLRTHPLTTERLSDMGNRIQSRPYRQVPDSLEFLLVRAKLRSQEGAARDAVTEFASRLRERRFVDGEIATHYGLARAQLRDGNPAGAESQLAELRRLNAASPMIETLAAEIRLKRDDPAGAARLLLAALPRYPQDRAIAYALIEAMLAARQAQQALQLAEEDAHAYPSDAKMHELRSRIYGALGKRLQQHRAQGEAYLLQGQLGRAVEQLELAQKAGDGNFYEQSQVDARLRELKGRAAEEARAAKQKQ